MAAQRPSKLPNHHAEKNDTNSGDTEGQSTRYKPVPWGEFRGRRAEGDFADYGTEVQIADYAIT